MRNKFTENKTLQRKWDKWLINGWYNFKTFGWVWFKFIQETHKERLINGRLVYKGSYQHLVDLNLKRCFMFSNDGFLAVPNPKIEVRAFIAERSRMLSSCLISDKFNRIEIFLMMDSFKWRYSRAMTRNAEVEILKRKRHQRKSGYHVRVMAREVSKEFDWKTVK